MYLAIMITNIMTFKTTNPHALKKASKKAQLHTSKGAISDVEKKSIDEFFFYNKCKRSCKVRQ